MQCKMMQHAWQCGQTCIARMGCVQSVLLLVMRLWMANAFWKSGLTKIADWDKTVWLFANEYQTPVLPPEAAAFFATAIELCCPILLVLGLMTRLATIPMLCMVAVIQFTYLSHVDHAHWAMLLCAILFFGPGKFSLDHFIQKKCIDSNHSKAGNC